MPPGYVVGDRRDTLATGSANPIARPNDQYHDLRICHNDHRTVRCGADPPRQQRNVVNRSPMRATAISWVIACGLLCGGAGVLVAAPSAASPGTAGSNDGGHGAHRGSDGNGPSGGRRNGGRGHNGPHKPPGGGTAGAGAPDRGVAGPGRRPAQPAGEIAAVSGYPGDAGVHPGWPCLPFPHFPPIVLPPLPPFPPLHWPRAAIGDGVAVARPPALRIAPPPRAAGGGSGGLIGTLPRTVPPPGEPGEPGEPPVVSAEHGTVGPAGLEPAPVQMPPLIGLPPTLEAPLRPAGPNTEAGPRGGPGRESPATRERPPATSTGAGTEVPPSTRVGYPEYLRDAKIGEVAALALPGFAGLLALTGLGGFLGYRQAKAGHVVRAAGTTRFMQ